MRFLLGVWALAIFAALVFGGVTINQALFMWLLEQAPSPAIHHELSVGTGQVLNA